VRPLKNLKRGLLLSLALNFVLFDNFSLHASEFSAIVEQQLAVDKKGHSQKFETTFKPEWQLEITDSSQMTLIGKFRFDSQDNYAPSAESPDNYGSFNGPIIAGSHGAVEIREWYLDTEFAASFWRVGKQQVSWGQADGLKVLDVINPQSFSEFILDEFEDSRIPLWMFNGEIPMNDDSSLQILWIPDLTYHEFAETEKRFQITSLIFVPNIPEDTFVSHFSKSKPSSNLSDSDLGIRYSLFYQGWDLTFNYLYHYHDSPVIFRHFSEQGLAIESRYKRNNLLGTTASNVFGDFTLRMEVGYSSDTYHLKQLTTAQLATDQLTTEGGILNTPEIASVFGLDWQGLQDIFISIQWFQSHLFDDDQTLVRPRDNQVLSFLYKQTFQNEIWELNWLTLYGKDQKDSSMQIELSYLLEDNLKISVAVDLFSGNIDGFFGQFKQSDQLSLEIEWGW
jgi:hypothetical protein